MNKHFFAAVSAAFLCLLPRELPAAEPFFTDARKFQLAARAEFEELGRDFSGAAYVSASGRYLVLDDTCKIFEMNIDGGEIRHQRTVRLRGLEDCEDIAVLADGRVAVTEERKGNLVFFKLGSETVSVDCSAECEVFHLTDIKGFRRKNSGLEALASDRAGDELYAGKEEFPRKIFRVTMGRAGLKSETPWDAEALLPAGSDIAGMEYFEGSLFILDERGKMLRQVDPENGKILSSFSLPRRRGLHRCEGISMTRKDRGIEMVITAEKNEVLVYRSGN